MSIKYTNCILRNYEHLILVAICYLCLNSDMNI